jgi:hypothetical protein
VDYRDHLIIDRYDPLLSGLPSKRLRQMAHAASEDILSWNAFRTLRQIDPSIWLPVLREEAGLPALFDAAGPVSIELWRRLAPPRSLPESPDEAPVELDVVIESPAWVWCIDAKYQGDIAIGTTNRPDRDQVLRGIDAGSAYAGVRAFAFSLLVRDRQMSPRGAEAVELYRNLAYTRAALASHRPDELVNLKHVGLFTWDVLGRVLSAAASGAARADERALAGRGAEWVRATARG